MSFLPLSSSLHHQHQQQDQDQQPPTAPLPFSLQPSNLASNTNFDPHPHTHPQDEQSLPTTSTPPPTSTDRSTSNLPPPTSPLTPFFTLITNTNSPTTHHPTVHYIFNDDLPSSDPITTAALDILAPASSPSSPSPRSETHNTSNENNIKERYVLLDMDETGTEVLSAQSMSPDWAVTGTEVVEAPTWGEGGNGALMLRIEGMEGVGNGDEGERGLEALVEVYERRLGELRRVVGEEGGRKCG